MNRSPIFLMLLLPSFLLAADAPAPDRPKSPAAVAAIAKADKAAAEAEAAYRAALLAAKRTELQELRAAQDLAMKSGPGQLAEANAIDAAARQVQAEVDAMSKGVKPATRPDGDAAKAGTPMPMGITGRWSISYSNKAARTYAFNPDGTVTRAEDKATIRPTRDGPALILDFGDGKVERVSQAGDRLLIEHFLTRADFPRKVGVLGVGVKSQ